MLLDQLSRTGNVNLACTCKEARVAVLQHAPRLNISMRPGAAAHAASSDQGTRVPHRAAAAAVLDLMASGDAGIAGPIQRRAAQ